MLSLSFSVTEFTAVKSRLSWTRTQSLLTVAVVIGSNRLLGKALPLLWLPLHRHCMSHWIHY